MRRVLAAVVGAVLGGLLALALVWWGVAGWVSVLVIAVGAVVGGVYGDRGVRALARLVGWI